MESTVNTEKCVYCEDHKPHLTKTETKVLKWLSSGYSVKEIAEKMNMSYDTARTHVENIKSKTGLSKNTELMGYYVAELNGKEFSLTKLREYGIAVFLIFVHVCKIDV